MDKWQAQHDFWSSFGVTAYEENSVPDDATFPRITYEASVGEFESLVPITASLWVRDTSWETADGITNNIESYIKSMGCPSIDGGRYRVYIGDTKFAQKMRDAEDDQIKRVLLNVVFEFMTK